MAGGASARPPRADVGGGEPAVLGPDAWAFAVADAAAGSGLALFVFATSSLSLPALLDRRDLDIITAANVSFNALRTNFAAMLAWAACIVLATALGLATGSWGSSSSCRSSAT